MQNLALKKLENIKFTNEMGRSELPVPFGRFLKSLSILIRAHLPFFFFREALVMAFVPPPRSGWKESGAKKFNVQNRIVIHGRIHNNASCHVMCFGTIQLFFLVNLSELQLCFGNTILIDN